MDTRQQDLGRFQVWMDNQVRIEQDRAKDLLTPTKQSLDFIIKRHGGSYRTPFSNVKAFGLSYSADVSKAMPHFDPSVRDLLAHLWEASYNSISAPERMTCHIRRVRSKIDVLDGGFSDKKSLTSYQVALEFGENHLFGYARAMFDQDWKPEVRLFTGSVADYNPHYNPRMEEWSKLLDSSTETRAKLAKGIMNSSMLVAYEPEIATTLPRKP